VFLFTAFHAAIAFAVERFFRFNRLVSWLIASIVFLWLMELFVVKGFPWLLLIPSMVWLLLVILFISALVNLAQRTNKTKEWNQVGWNLLLEKTNIHMPTRQDAVSHL